MSFVCPGGSDEAVPCSPIHFIAGVGSTACLLLIMCDAFLFEMLGHALCPPPPPSVLPRGILHGNVVFCDLHSKTRCTCCTCPFESNDKGSSLSQRSWLVCIMFTAVSMGADLQPGRLADQLVIGFGQPQIRLPTSELLISERKNYLSGYCKAPPPNE